MTQDAVAILYQALPPPVIDGLRKDAKPGGYSDGGADIAFVLRGRGHRVLTPVADPDPARPIDWVFPDTVEGIAAAMAAGATILWANSVLFEGHPLEAVLGHVRIVGQLPELMQRYDDKFATNRMLAEAGLSVARSFLLAQAARPGVVALAEVEGALGEASLRFPLIVKPVRGRGSQGVSRVCDLAALVLAATGLIADAKFGNTLIIEEYLGGEEVTVTVMPPVDGVYRALRPVRRFNQKDGVAPYNGDVAVTANSVAIDEGELAAPAVQAMLDACVRAAELVGARAVIRIDCRADGDGDYKLFDLNMKPNMTGPGRPGRDDQDCLSAIAARADGWDFAQLLEAMLAAAW
ncbi:biotin carboxylase [Sphingobium rhizovicinum]|uniref:Biotin carboxylase n=1 Tax=Sphingobium rhizovicinum TaxID=432308 RepID=A0ABV7NEB9_9SPHN